MVLGTLLVLGTGLVIGTLLVLGTGLVPGTVVPVVCGRRSAGRLIERNPGDLVGPGRAGPQQQKRRSASMTKLLHFTRHDWTGRSWS